ncbi:MAG: hypothetical protein V4653_04205 [Pseudomonadota bacterium]
MAFRYLMLGFLAGAISVPIFHQLTVLALHSAGLVPNAPWSMRPVPPLGVPTILNQAFWGGMWGVLFGLIMIGRPRKHTIFAGIAVGMLGAAMVNLTLLPWLRGLPMPIDDIYRWWRPMLINGVWGLGIGIIFLALRGRAAEQ